MYGLYPRKGSVAVGFDADITLWDPHRKETLRQEILHHGADYTPYEGLEVVGWPVATILRGEVVAENGNICGQPGGGKFLNRTRSPYAVPKLPFAKTIPRLLAKKRSPEHSVDFRLGLTHCSVTA
jgi:dihydropyrimidinase